jgi:DNA-binding CsgD family transcriptional regulator
MNLFKQLRHVFTPANPRVYQFDQELVESLQLMAAHDQRDEDELASELLAYAIHQRQSAEKYWQSWLTLSERERQVAALVCLNHTNQQIATRLVISPETVKTHVRNVLVKYSFNRKVELRQALNGWNFNAWEDIQ